MFRFRKGFITLILIGLVYGWFFIFQTNKPTELNVSGINENVDLFIQPEAGKTPIASVIENAKKEILVEVYLLSDKDIIQSLIDAFKRGVDVKIILEEHPFGGGNINKKTKQELDSVGVPVKWSSPAFSLTHEKAILVDGTKAFILNQNLTASSFSKNREYNAIDSSRADVYELRNIFIADWQRSQFSSNNTNLIFSPDNSRPALTSLIKQAQVNIDIEMEVIEDDAMIQLLSEKAKNATVRILAPPLNAIKSNKKALSILKNSGAIVKTLSTPYIHAKLIITDNRKAYLGSINLTTQSLDKNREVGVIITQTSSLMLLKETFDRDWGHAINFK